MAKAIRNFDEREGHAESTASFIDANFSDNSGRTLKALRSRNAWKKLRVNAICEKAAKIMEDRHVHTCPYFLSPDKLLDQITHRVRLYKKGDRISDAVLQRKLKSEYVALAQLAQFIFWTSVGKEGALHFKEQLRQKRMAEQLHESVANGISLEKTQKMIKSSIDAQQKVDARKAGRNRYRRSGEASRGRAGRSRGRGGRRARGRGGRGGRGRGRGGRSAAPASGSSSGSATGPT